MASAFIAPSAIPLESVGVSHLANAMIPTPPQDTFALAGLILSGGFDTLADPRPDAFQKTGLPGPVHGLVWFDRIHIVPRRRDLGSVVSEQQIAVEVWNAYLERAQILDDVIVTGPAGIEVVHHLSLPAHFASSDSQMYEIKIEAEGDPQIDNVVTWEFDDIDPSGTDLRILGFRLIPFPFEPNMARPVVESFGYLTDIITAFSSMEQRVQLRVVPIGSISYHVILNETRDAQMANAILFGNQPRAFGVARWPFRTRLTQAATEDDFNVYCDTTDVPFIVHGLVMLWTGPYRWEVQTIASVESDHLVLTTGVRNSWAAMVTTVVPMVVGRLSKNEAMTWESLMLASQVLTFDIDGYTP